MSEAFESADSRINWNHEATKQRTDIRNDKLHSIPLETSQLIDRAFSLYPKNPAVSPHSVLGLELVTIAEERNKISHDTGIFFISGIGGTAAGGVQVLDAIQSQAKHDGMDIGVAGFIGSPVSYDTNDSEYVDSNILKAKYEAAVIIEQLKQTPVKNIYLWGHSQGGVEAAILAPALQEAFQQAGIETKIAGLILEMAGGQFNQKGDPVTKRLRFAANAVTTVGTLNREIAWNYPSLLDIQKVEGELQEAQQFQDPEAVFRLRQVLTILNQRYFNPDLPAHQKAVVQSFDSQIEDALQKGDQKTANKLAKKRADIARPYAQEKLVGTDEGALERKQSTSEQIHMARTTIVRKNQAIISQIPDWVRNKNIFPTTVVFGTEDPYFPAQEGVLGMFGTPKKGSGDYLSPYPNAPVLEVVVAQQKPHIWVASNPEESAALGLRLIHKMENDMKEKTKDQPQKLDLIRAA